MTKTAGDTAHESFWDTAYRRGDHVEHWESLDVEGELTDALDAESLAPGRRALDVGCGGGREALWLAARGLEVVGVDASVGALERARERAARAGLQVDWRRGSALALPVADRSRDLAIDRGCLHVIARRSRRRYARELARVLAPGATFVLWAARHDDEELGLVGVSTYELRRLFEPRGLTITHRKPLPLTAPAGDLAAVRYTLG